MDRACAAMASSMVPTRPHGPAAAQLMSARICGGSKGRDVFRDCSICPSMMASVMVPTSHDGAPPTCS